MHSSAQGVFEATIPTENCQMSRKCELLCRVFRIAPWVPNTNPNTTLVDHQEWLSPTRCPGLHNFHKLGLKLGENFPGLNTEGKKKKRKEMLSVSQINPMPACFLQQSKNLLLDKTKSNQKDESASSKNLLFTPKSKL